MGKGIVSCGQKKGWKHETLVGVCVRVCLPHQRKTAVEKEVSLLYCWCCVCLQDPGQMVYFPCRHCKLWQTSSLTDTQGRQTNWSTGGTKEQTQLCAIIARDKQQRKVKGKGKWEWYQSSSLLFRFRPQVHLFLNCTTLWPCTKLENPKHFQYILSGQR